MPDWILSNVAKIVSPDWGELVGLIPLAVATIVALFLAWLVRRAVTAPPRHIGPHGAAVAPAVTHGPGPSLAPLFVAFGAFCFFLALLFVRVGPRIDPDTKQPIPDSSAWTIQPFGALALVIGVVALAGGLLYWGREATRDYDALDRSRAMAIRAAAEPPPGVHVPGPSFRPLVFALAISVLLLGLAVNIAIAIGGLVMLVIAMLGWLRDAGLEYVEVERADRTGHLANIPAPRFPIGTLATFALIFAFSALVATGLVPPQAGSAAAGGATASRAPGPAASAAAGAASPAPGGAPAATPAPGAGGPAAATLEIAAAGVQFDKAELEAPADKPFAIAFTNNDAGIPHNVAIHKDSPTGAEVWKGEIFSGVATKTYQVPALPAGTYGFICSVHPSMTGTLTVK